jgi:hypothetical protein
VRESRWGSEREQVARVHRLSVSVAICTPGGGADAGMRAWSISPKL